MASIRVVPKTLPIAIVDGHTYSQITNGRIRNRDTGESRIRSRYSTVPEQLHVGWILPLQEQFDVFDEWYEEDLASGTLNFDLQIDNRGTATEFTWYTCQFEGDYRCEVLDPFGYQIRATLRLVEDLGTLRIPPGIESTIGLRFGLSARTVPPTLAATIGLHFGLQARMALPSLQASIGLSFGLAWLQPPAPPPAEARETDAGAGRETDAGVTRETD